MMSVVYSVGVRFNGPGLGQTAYRTVSETWRRGRLRQVVTTSFNPSEVDPRIFTLVRLPSVVARLGTWLRLPEGRRSALKDGLYARSSAGRLRLSEATLAHLWTNYALESLAVATALGVPTLLSRANAHPRVQVALLSAELEAFGIGGRRDHFDVRHLERASLEMERAGHICVPSEFAASSLVDEGIPRSKVTLIPYGVDATRFATRSVAVETQPFRLLFVGQVGVRKGVPRLLEAWRRLALPGAELILAGPDGDEMTRLWPRFSGIKAVRRLGRVADTALLYGRASAFALPSIEEGSALVTYEAMAAALPVITTPSAGSVVEDGRSGFIVPAGDGLALEEAILRLYREPRLRRDMGEEARKRASAFSWDRYSSAVADLQERLSATTATESAG